MTVREIAAYAKVSPATVSLVLNNRPGVSAQRRREIQAILRENGYQIKEAPAQAVPNKQIYIVKCRAHYENDEFSIVLIDAIEEYANQSGFTVSILNVDGNTYEQKLSGLDYSKIQGIVFFASEMTNDCLHYTLHMPMPTVYVDNFSDYFAINTVNADQRLISSLAAKHLVNLGHRKVGYLKTAPMRGYLHQRFHYFEAALHGLDAVLLPEFIFEIDLFSENINELLRPLFGQVKEFPTAIFAESDTIAASCVHVLIEMGFSIPEDISVISVDNTKICSYTTPQLTSIDVNAREMGRLAFERLEQLIREPSRPIVHSYITPFLVRRNSTGSAKGRAAD